jgi:hypothetical protein
LSGPAILQISNYWNAGDTIEVDFLPGKDLLVLIPEWQQTRPRSELKTLLGEIMPKRLAACITETNDVHKSVNRFTQGEIQTIARLFHGWEFTPSGTEGYAVAEVTRGGIDTDEISSKTFESKKVKGLYCIGEVLDVTGNLGGYNLQWAWSSGYCAGLFV